MKIAIFGAGGIGSYLGAALARQGADVTLICRGAHLAAIRQHGLRVVGTAGDFSVDNLRATDDPGAVGEVDVIISCVKLYDLAAVTPSMLPMIGAGTMVIPIQNGVTAHEEIAAVVGREHVLGGTVFMSSFIREPGVVELKSEQASITFGELQGGISPRVQAFAQLCESAGIRAHAARDILIELWHKFIMLGGTAALCCLSRQSIGVIRSDAHLRSLLLQAMQEVLTLAQAKQVSVDGSFIAEAMQFTDKVHPATKVSMLEDIEAGKPLELEWITGHIVREAQAAGVATPINDIAYACTHLLAAGATSVQRQLPRRMNPAIPTLLEST
ncbi:MAG: 2-dehydropantoate 2-reductase [Pseudomonadota bacterium]